MDLKQAHDIGESLQQKIEKFPDVERAFVHVDYNFEHIPSDEHKIIWWLKMEHISLEEMYTLNENLERQYSYSSQSSIDLFTNRNLFGIINST